jgi:hypothetical protein
MVKTCSLVDDLDNPLCLPYSGGQCKYSRYKISWTYDLVISGAGAQNPGRFPMEANTGFITSQNRWIQGKLGCISSPMFNVNYLNGYTFCTHTVEYVNSYTNRETRTFKIGEAFYLDPIWETYAAIENVVMVGIFPLFGDRDDCGDFVPPQKLECHCGTNDEEISCTSASGGICCISKDIINQICAKV